MMSDTTFDIIIPDISSQLSDWPSGVRVVQTTVGKQTASPYGTQNLAFHVQDSPSAVHANRCRLLSVLRSQGVSQLHWLTQVHGTKSINITARDDLIATPSSADAMRTELIGHGLAIMTADCLPIVMTDGLGNEVAAIHAGWRGLQSGIIQKTAATMQQPPAYAWVGAAISQAHFEVGKEVVTAFTTDDAELIPYFVSKASDVDSMSGKASRQHQDKYHADLAGIAMHYLSRMGVQAIASGLCSYADPRFYSYREATHAGQPDSRTGRMATIIWKTKDAS